MRTSIIVPVLNEAALIKSFLKHLRQRAPDAEIIVADGTSADGTAQGAAQLCDHLVQTKAGRAKQMNAGASVARGDVFWFVHVDATIQDLALAQVDRALQDPQVVGGFFRIEIPRARFVYRLTDCFAHYIGLLLGVRCGDHAFFCRRETFERIGGFPEVELMEDVDFFRKLRAAGRIAVVTPALIVDPRRYDRIGPWRLTIAFGVIWVLYFLRVPRRTLQRIYRRFCCRS